MKKIITLTLIIFMALFITGCDNDEKYGLIELTSAELFDVLLDEKPSIVLATYNERDPLAKEFLDSLEKTSRRAHENIYYVDSRFSALDFDEVFGELTGANISALRYYVFQDGNIIAAESYTTYNQMFKTLNGKKYKYEVKKEDPVLKEQYLSAAKEAYDAGDIAAAYNSLALTIDTPAAKAEYNNNPYYKLIGSWRELVPTEEEGKYIYTNIVFVKFESLIYECKNKNIVLEGFEGAYQDEYKDFEYKIEDDIIYKKNTKTNKYTVEYEIVNLTDNFLTLRQKDKEYKLQFEEE